MLALVFVMFRCVCVPVIGGLMGLLGAHIILGRCGCGERFFACLEYWWCDDGKVEMALDPQQKSRVEA